MERISLFKLMNKMNVKTGRIRPIELMNKNNKQT